MTKAKCGTLALVLVVAGLAAMNAHAFKIISKHGKEVRWKNLPVKYYLPEEGPKYFLTKDSDGLGESASLKEIIERSFESWKATPGVTLDYQYAGSVAKPKGGDDEKNEFIFVHEGWLDLDFAPPSGALAVTISTYDADAGEILDSDIYFNDEYFNWANLDTPSEISSGYLIDIQNIATHEIGHLFGLDHSSDTPGEPNDQLYYATMYYSSYAGDISRRLLANDDKDAITHLYPDKETDSSIPTPKLLDISPRSGSNNGPVIKMTIKGESFGPTTLVRIVGNDMKNDEACKPISSSSDTIECYMDLYYVSKGIYNMIVSNTADKFSVLTGSFTVDGDSFNDNKVGSGCGMTGGSSSNASVILLIGMIILIYPIRFWGRNRRVPVKIGPKK